MTVSPESTSAPRFTRILVVRLSSMGDIIHTLPAVTTLRQAFPNATLGWLVEERWAELLCTLRYPRSGKRSPQRPLVDYVHTVNLAGWRRAPFALNTWQQAASGLSHLRGNEYEIAIDFQGAIRSALLARWSGATTVLGAAQPRENAASLWYSRQVQPHGNHVVEQALSLAQAVIGQPVPLAQAVFPVDDAADKKIAPLLVNTPRFAVLNPGAGWGAKQWPPERYGFVARELAQDGLPSFVNYGPGEEALAAEVGTASAGTAQPISCSISELISLTRRASLFIGGDTGPMHLAAALGIPVIGIFGPTDPARNGPFSSRSIVLRSSNSLTSHARLVEPEQGLLEITAEEVAAAARRLLRGSRD